MKAVIAAVLAVAAASSWAALGGGVANLGNHPAASKSSRAATSGASYSILERELDSGTKVREYVDGNNVVFAVTWSGPYLPDLKELLGAHFDTMVAQAKKAAKSERGQVRVNEPEIVINSGGHMGDFEGRAWLPGKLPAGFKPGDIQ
jgi:hypothetical protein